jgi:hypothetical protein
MDLPRHFTIRESSHRIHNPFTSEKLATLGQALRPPPGTRMLDLACGTGIGATWIGGGVPGTVELLRRSLQPGGMMLIGEPYWRREPPDQATVEGCDAIGSADFLPLPELVDRFGGLGCDVVEMVLASQDSWDRYAAAQWLNIRRWLDANPDDELASSCARNSPPRPRDTSGTGANTSAGVSSR